MKPALAIESGRIHHQAGRLADAERIYRQILLEQPDHAVAMHLLGVLAHQMGRDENAIELIRRAIAIDPSMADAYSNLGSILQRQGRFDEAVAACSRAAALQPDLSDAHLNLGVALRDQGTSTRAEFHFRRAIDLNPADAAAHDHLGTVLRSLGRLGQAVAAYSRAVELNPDFCDALINLGGALMDQGSLDEALACFDRAVALRPGDPDLASRRIFLLNFHPRFDSAAILREQIAWDRRFGGPLRKSIGVHANDRDPDRRLRIGYVSPNFRDHVTGRNMLPLIREHSRESYAVYCYSDDARSDVVTAEFRKHAFGWRNIAGVGDDAFADMVRADGIDVLVDLSMHMTPTRLAGFARKPAPVQFTFAAYPGGVGLSAIDCRLTDPYLDPPGASDANYVERSIRLSSSFWCYDPASMSLGMDSDPDPGPLPAPQAGYATFGCLNNYCKINPQTLLLWARVLREVQDSRLLLLSQPGDHRRRAADVFNGAGVDPGRLEFLSWRSRSEYCKCYHRIDIALDTLPYNGHTTSLDAFWMGAPVVTLVGQTVVGRAGLSQLSNLGLTEMVARTPAEFVSIATDLARDLPRLAALRASLRGRMLRSPLTDAKRFAGDIERAYRSAWKRWTRTR
ncbi:MAG TPA: tetratricopeptide repeat protein [Tepidisphaeraceae bacterium]|jgi:predicted O-linked N-acetylglucosamine transferase (SPINDLY family)|nr:tetratricopeptide repeat protein [Tepidisphaeraceae bacterium]